MSPSQILSDEWFTLEVFAQMLKALDPKLVQDIITIDIPDADNKALLLAAIALWLKNGALAPFHVVVVNRRFSSENAAGVFNPETKTFSFEETPGAKPVELDTKSFLAAKLKEGPNEVYDLEDERMLLGINVASLRALVRDAFPDVNLDSIHFYNGGTAAVGGIGPCVHKTEWKFFKGVGQGIMEHTSFEGPVELATAAEIHEFDAAWLALRPDERSAFLKAAFEAIPPNLRYTIPLLPLEHSDDSSPKKQRTEGGSAPAYAPEVRALVDFAEGGGVFRVFSGAPLTGAVALPEVVRHRVVYLAAMFGALDDGSKNVLKGNFNHVVDEPAAEKLMGGAYFPNARVVFFPTNFFKTAFPTPDGVCNEVCTLPAATIAAVKETSKPLQWIAALVAQWTALNPRGLQPLFDVAVLFDLLTSARLFKIFATAGLVGPKLVHKGETKSWIDEAAPFPKGFYTVDANGLDGVEGGNFAFEARNVLSVFFADLF